jgi:hypothetical protein
VFLASYDCGYVLDLKDNQLTLGGECGIWCSHFMLHDIPASSPKPSIQYPRYLVTPTPKGKRPHTPSITQDPLIQIPEMPDNTWFTPYILPHKDCLSIAASQGVVCKLSEHHVLKTPYQYPVKGVGEGTSDIDETIEQLELSQCSVDSFENERAFYQLLETTDLYDIVRVDLSSFENGIVLEYLQPLETAWYTSSAESRLRWIKQLLRANAKIEELGYTHGNLAIRNMRSGWK